MTRSKNYLKKIKLLDVHKIYEPEEALTLAKKTANIKFDSSLELHMKLGIDPKKGDQQVRAMLDLPHELGKKITVAAFVETGSEDEAKKAGADIVGGEELINEIKQTGKCNFDVAVAMPMLMAKLTHIAKILGPKGLMPSPKNETVGKNITELIASIKSGKRSYKNDDSGNVHIVIGKASFDDKKLLENLLAAIESIKKNKPPAAKGIFIKNAALSSTMGPGIKLNLDSI